MISVIIPVYNEESNVNILTEKLTKALSLIKTSYEIIYVNDASIDKTYDFLKIQAEQNKFIKVINFNRNYGQTAAIVAGIDYAQGDIIIPMDGDLQNDPNDIRKLIDKLNEGFDLVSGWRKNRKDNILRKIPSVLANKLISKFTGLKLHDYGCTLKAYRKDVIKNLQLYGEMHRFIPLYAVMKGARVAEIEVNHFPRIYGKSNYGYNRIIKVLFDLILIKFLFKYSTKPIYIFGSVGLLSFLISFISFFYAIYLKIFEGRSFILTPLLLIATTCFIMGFMAFLMGLLAELITRTYYESQKKSIYEISSSFNLS